MYACHTRSRLRSGRRAQLLACLTQTRCRTEPCTPTSWRQTCACPSSQPCSASKHGHTQAACGSTCSQRQPKTATDCSRPWTLGCRKRCAMLQRRCWHRSARLCGQMVGGWRLQSCRYCCACAAAASKHLILVVGLHSMYTSCSVNHVVPTPTHCHYLTTICRHHSGGARSFSRSAAAGPTVARTLHRPRPHPVHNPLPRPCSAPLHRPPGRVPASRLRAPRACANA